MMSSSPPHHIEMHCHTVFSPDAWRTPEQLVEIAAANNVQVLSITDHNHLGAQERAAQHAAKFDMRYVPGVEIDALAPDGKTYHFVCFDFDLQNAAFRSVATQRSSIYPLQFLDIHPHLQEFGYALDLDEMQEQLPKRYPTNPAPTLNQWFARDLLLQQGKIPDKAAFAQLMREIGQKRQVAGDLKTWPQITFETMRDAVHAAGGKVLLAHVARYYRGAMDEQLSAIEALLEQDMDGFELYHPDNVLEPEFHRLQDMAQNTECLLSCGSDCHDVLAENSNRHFAKMTVEDWFLERMV